jgi:hypothetical protein
MIDRVNSEFDLTGFYLTGRTTAGATIEHTGQHRIRLAIPAGPIGQYRLAQLDDYAGLKRPAFAHQPPFHLCLKLRASESALPGTWGFGLWNDPFGLGLPGMGGGLGLPALPQAAWFFHASPENYLSLEDSGPENGWLAMTFTSSRLRPWDYALAMLLPLLAIPAGRRSLRRIARRFVRSQAVELGVNPEDWHLYCLDWREGGANFRVDDKLVFESELSPVGRLGLVIWIDNQFMGYMPDGRLQYGLLVNPEAAWIEVELGG